jgi:translation initiation factor 6
MPFYQSDFLGESWLGLFAIATDKYCFVSRRLSKTKCNKIAKALKVKVVPTTIADTSLVGIMGAANSSGIVLPYLINEAECKLIKKFTKIGILFERFTALGNLIVVNDNGAVVSPVFCSDTIKSIEKTLKIKAVQMQIAGSQEVGSLCLATNKGFLVSPDASDEEFKKLEEIFKVNGSRASANFGSTAIGSCVIANSYGCVVDKKTTAIELQYISEGLGL